MARTWIGRGSDVARVWPGCRSDVARTWLGCHSDVFSGVVAKVWQKLRERGLQQLRVPSGVPEGGVWGRVRVGGGGWVSCEKQGKQEGGGVRGGWDGDRQRASQCARVCQNDPLANYPLVSPRCLLPP